jgi:thiamine biosynthesis protein ThiS
VNLTITVNGEPKEIASGATLVDLLQALELKPERLAIELNRKIIRRTNWNTAHLEEGDKIEIVHFVGGGSLA